MTILSTLNRTITAIRFRMARAAPLTVAGRRPQYLTAAELDEGIARRRERSEPHRRGWETRRNHPLDPDQCSRSGNRPAGPGFGSTPPLSQQSKGA